MSKKKDRTQDKLSAKNMEELSRQNVEVISKITKEAEGDRTFGEAMADIFARAVGSWTFIIIQSALLILWVTANVMRIIKPWDPYPFILLNLALSFQAAYASPIIMMSQNRLERVADQRNHLALQVALLAEQEDTKTLQLLHRICEHLKIPVGDEEVSALQGATNPEILIRLIKEASDKTK
jgi:uncharacterized membrane protein